MKSSLNLSGLEKLRSQECITSEKPHEPGKECPENALSAGSSSLLASGPVTACSPATVLISPRRASSLLTWAQTPVWMVVGSTIVDLFFSLFFLDILISGLDDLHWNVAISIILIYTRIWTPAVLGKNVLILNVVKKY